MYTWEMPTTSILKGVRQKMMEFTNLEDSVLDRISVEKSLQGLSPEERDVLVLYYYEGYTLKETAQILAERHREGTLSLTGAKYIRDKALNKVRKQLNLV